MKINLGYILKTLATLVFESPILPHFENLALCLFTKYNSFLGVCYFGQKSNYLILTLQSRNSIFLMCSEMIYIKNNDLSLKNTTRWISFGPAWTSLNLFSFLFFQVMSSHGSEVGPLLLKENIGPTLRTLLVQEPKNNNTR